MTALQSVSAFVSLVLLGGLWKGWRSFQRSARHHAIDREIHQARSERTIQEWSR